MLYLLFKRLAACIHHLSDSCSLPFLLLEKEWGGLTPSMLMAAILK